MKYMDLRNQYILERTVGSGGFAKVKLATHVQTGEKVAIKIMKKATLGDDLPRIQLEIDALKHISHQHICKLFQVIETGTHIFMVIEYCPGGELLDHIVAKEKLSEKESRQFFRQILSAVAYLHKQGYAHRDLKPENVLLDQNQKLKLIDFGLCAKPEGGLQSQLQTSCGSPNYAAPEVIKGNQYFGSETDVWSMGVMLYALLCGYLPFDSDSIEHLYGKIMKGTYSEPAFLSPGSKQIIRCMLQVDPNDRIKIPDLLNHSWLKRGFDDKPIDPTSDHELHEKDKEVLRAMANHKNISMEDMWSELNLWKYDYETCTYLLLLARKKQGLPLRLNTEFARKYRARQMDGFTSPQITVKSPEKENSVESSCQEGIQRKRNRSPTIAPSPIPCKKEKLPPPTFVPPFDFEEPSSRFASNRDVPKVPPHKDPPHTPVSRHPQPGYFNTPLIKELPPTPKTPKRALEDGFMSNSPGCKKLLSSIERRFHKMRNVLTPRRKYSVDEASPLRPTVLTNKEVCNVSTTTCKDADEVLNELKLALLSRGITCKVKGYTLRGKIFSENGKSCKLSFELEVCMIKSGGGGTSATGQEASGDNERMIVGVRRKRLTGDAWCYKKVCEEILTLTRNKPDEGAPNQSKRARV